VPQNLFRNDGAVVARVILRDAASPRCEPKSVMTFLRIVITL
jgi:hypothetical protein